MATTGEPERTFVCCVVFLDIVGFSKQPVSQQISWKRELNEIIAKAVAGVAVEDRVLLDTGDGASLCFLGDPEMALTAALSMVDDFSKRGRELNPPLLVRIGINMGSVRVITDFNGQRNIVGDGINVGQRIMSFARENQILTSRTFAEIISCLTPTYEDLFIPRGKHADKHGREHEVFEIRNVCDLLEAPPAGAPVVNPIPTGLAIAPAPKEPHHYPPEAIHALKTLMTSALGPIASVLVTRACKTEQSLDLLCETLASQIAAGDARIKFVQGVAKILHQHRGQPSSVPPSSAPEAAAQSKPASVFDAGYLSQLEKMLVDYLGPISKVLVKRDSAAATSKDELVARLAKHIDNEAQKKKFEERAAKAQ